MNCEKELLAFKLLGVAELSIYGPNPRQRQPTTPALARTDVLSLQRTLSAQLTPNQANPAGFGRRIFEKTRNPWFFRVV
jgi:hypothetical protein